MRRPPPGARVSATAIWMLTASLPGCGLEEHPRGARSALTADGSTSTGGEDGPPAPPGADAPTVEPPPHGSPDGATAVLPADAGPRLADGPSQPTSGVGVMINGVMVPREKVIVLLAVGHSNMAGRAQGPPELKPYFYGTDPHLWQYQKGGVWKPAKEPLSPDGGTPGYPQGAGPGMALLRRALVAAPDAYIVAIERGTSLDFAANCFNFRKGGVHYDAVMGPALELKGRVTFGGLFTMLGYDGRTNPAAQKGGYISCMEGLAADFRADLGEPNLPFVAGDYERGAIGTWSPTCCGAPQVITQLAMIPARVPHSYLIPTDGLPMQDNHHFNMTGHMTWADRAFMGMATNGLLPWATTH